MLPEAKVKSIASAHLNHFSIQNRKEISMIIDVVEISHLREYLKQNVLAEISLVRQKFETLQDSMIREIEDSIKNPLPHKYNVYES
jgi:hypothetical protein